MDRIIRIRLDSRQAEQGIDRLDNDMRGLGRTSDGIQTKLTAVASALAAAFSVEQIAAYADAYTNIQNRLRVVTDSTEQLTRVTASLLQTANDTRASFDETSSLYSKLARSTEELGISEERLIAITSTINKSFAVQGANAESAANAIRQLAQGLDAGALRGDEFNSVAEQAPAILRAVQEELGVSRAELRDLAAEGAITAELLIRSAEAYADTVDKEYGQTNRTFEQSAVVAKNNATAFVGSSKLIQGATEAAGNALVNFSENLETASQAIVAITAVIAGRYAAGLVAANAAAIQLAVGVATGNASLITGAKAAAGKAAAVAQSAAADLAAAQASAAVTAAERARFVAVQASIKADLELETVRLRAQISDIGRQQSIQRLTALRLELAAATTGLARAEAAAAASEAAVTASANAAAAATTRLSVAQSAATVSGRALSVAQGGLSAALALVGGPVGAAILAAGGLAYFVTQAISSQREAERLANSARGLNSELEKTNKVYENYRKSQDSVAAQSIKGLGQAELQKQFRRSSDLVLLYRERIEQLKESGASYARISSLEERLKGEQAILDAINNSSPQIAKNAERSGDLALRLGDLAAQVNLTSIEYSVFAERQRLIKDGFSTAEIDKYIESYRALLQLQESNRAKAKTGSATASPAAPASVRSPGSAIADSLDTENALIDNALALRAEAYRTYGATINDINAGEFERQRAQLELSLIEQTNALNLSQQADIARIEARRQQIFENESLSAAEKIEIGRLLDEQLILQEQTTQQSLTEINAEGVAARQQLAEYEKQTRLMQLGNLGNALMTLGEGQSKGIFKIGQKLALAQAAIALPTAVMESFKNGGGYPWGLVPAAAMAATGLKNIQNIRNASYGGSAGAVALGSGGGGGGASAGGGPSTLPTTPQSAPNVQTLEIRGLDEIRDELRNQDGMVSTRFVATILDKISDANRIRGEG